MIIKLVNSETRGYRKFEYNSRNRVVRKVTDRKVNTKRRASLKVTLDARTKVLKKIVKKGYQAAYVDNNNNLVIYY